MYNSSLKILRLLSPELSHTITINFLKYFKVRQKNIEDPILAQHLMGLDFRNPIGLAAGFDKNAEVMHSMFSFGFGFLEVGTITPQPQSGNSKPRVFRLSEDKAIINSLGFNNKGIKKAKKNLMKYQKSYLNNKIVGVNIGKNKNSSEAIDDYLIGLEELGDLASYITINISSPNTEGLRDLQLRGKIEKLIKKIIDKRDEIKNINTKPILIKISPDLNEDQLRDIALISLANKHPRVNILNPGCGVGGHCISVDPWFIVNSSNGKAQIIEQARQINDFKPDWVLEKIKNALLQFEIKHKKKPTVTCMGLSFKPNVGDLRESPALYIAKKSGRTGQKRLFSIVLSFTCINKPTFTRICRLYVPLV